MKKDKNIHPSYQIVSLSIGIIIGAIILNLIGDIIPKTVLAIPISILLLVFSIIKSSRVVCILSFMAGIIMIFSRLEKGESFLDVAKNIYGQDIELAGEIYQDPEIDNEEVKFKIKNIFFQGQKYSGMIYVKVSKNTVVNLNYQENNTDLAEKNSLDKSEEGDEILVRRSDTITLKGKILEGFGVFDGYLYKPRITHIARPSPGDITIETRNWLLKRIEFMIEAPNSKLAAGFLLGVKSGIPKELNDKIRKVGLAHVIVASGAHLAIIISVTKRFFKNTTRLMLVSSSIVFCIFFTIMVGATPSIIRAALITILTMIAWYSGRSLESWRAVILVMAITLMISPVFIIDVGWQLSFAAYIGILFISPALQKYFYGKKESGFLSGLIIQSVAAIIITTPIQIYYFGSISLFAIFTNILISPTVSIVMLSAFITGIFCGVPVISGLFAHIVRVVTDYEIAVINIFSSHDEFLITLPKNDMRIFLIYVPIIIVVVIILCVQKHKKLMLERTNLA